MNVSLTIHSATLCRLVLAPVLRHSLLNHCHRVLDSWRCGRASSNRSMHSKPANVPASSNACLAGPLDHVGLLQNVPPAVVSGQRIPPNSPAVVSRRVSLIPSSSFFLPSHKPRCIHRRQVQHPFNLSDDSDAPDSLSPMFRITYSKMMHHPKPSPI